MSHCQLIRMIMSGCCDIITQGANQLLPAGMQLGLLGVPRQHAGTHSQQTCRSMQHLQTIAPVADLAEGLEAPVQLVYLATLLGFLVVGAYLVVRQVCSISCISISVYSTAYKTCALLTSMPKSAWFCVYVAGTGDQGA